MSSDLIAINVKLVRYIRFEFNRFNMYVQFICKFNSIPTM